MRWFRYYDEALDDPKVQRLAPHLFKTWVNLLCLASKGNGTLPSNDDIAFRLRISACDAAQQIDELILAGLVDIGPDGERIPHNWEKRQYASDSSSERVRKHRETKKKTECNVSGNVSVTPQIQNRTEQNREEKDICAVSPSRAKARRAVSTEEIDQQFDEFWKAFPPGRKNGKGKARITFRLVARGGHHSLKATAQQMIDAATKYAATKPDPQFTPSPLTWLNQGRWEDDVNDGRKLEPSVAPRDFDWSQGPSWWREEHERMKGAN